MDNLTLCNTEPHIISFVEKLLIICISFNDNIRCISIKNLTCVLFPVKRKLILKSVFQAVTEKNFETQDFRASLENGVLLCE